MPKAKAAPAHSSNFGAKDRSFSSTAMLQLEAELRERQALSLNNVIDKALISACLKLDAFSRLFATRLRKVHRTLPATSMSLQTTIAGLVLSLTSRMFPVTRGA